MWSNVVNKMECIAVGGGPSARLLEGCVQLRLVGSGNVSKFLKLTKYCYGDYDHFANIPEDIETFSSERNVGDKEGMTLFPAFLPMASSAGGMSISLACHLSKPGDLVGIIGFDGYDRFGIPYDEPSREEHAKLMKYWIDKGYQLVSLMHLSAFNHCLLRWDQVDSIIKAISK